MPYYKYLGTFFTSSLSWRKAKQTSALQASKAVINILKYQKYFGYFYATEAFKLFDAIVTPILVYSSNVWGYQYSDVIEQVHYSFCKRICCLNKNVPNFVALSECGRLPLSTVYMTNCVKYWSKLTCMPNHRYPKQTYNMLRDLDQTGRVTWATHIRGLLF